jgi:hypothetical protein
VRDFKRRFWYVALWLGISAAPLLVALASDTALVDRILQDTYRATNGKLYFDYNFHKYYLAALRIPLVALGIFSSSIPLIFALAARIWRGRGSNPFEYLFNRLSKTPLPVFFGFAFVCLLGFAYVVLCDFANSADEWSFLFQADTFTKGEVFKESRGITDRLLFYLHIGVTDGKIYSIMFPGWPLLLALGVRLGLPGIINPLISLITLIFIYRAGKDFFNRRVGVLSAVICLLSPFYLFNSGSYFSHPAGLFWGVGAVWLFYRAVKGSSPGAAFFSGLFLGLELLTRPYDAIAIGLPMAAFGIYAICKEIGLKRGLQLAALFLVGAGIGAAALLAYNNAVTGSPWVAPLYYSGASIKPGFEQQDYHIHTLLDGLTLTFSHMMDLLAFMPAASLLLLAPVLASKKRWIEWFLIAEIAAIVAVYSAYPAYGGNQYGPRYYYSGLGFLAILLARGAVLAYDDVKQRLGQPGVFGFTVVSL